MTALMNARRLIDEMAAAPASIRSRPYYHGTDKRQRGEKILADGFLVAPTIEDLNTRYKNAYHRPVEGRVYLSPSLRFAVIYALGGVMMGHKPFYDRLERDGQYGYLFVVDGTEVRDVEPDEDVLGELVWRLAKSDRLEPSEYNDHPELTAALKADPALVRELSGWFKHALTPSMLARAGDGESIWQSKAGKRLIARLPERLRVRVVELGASIGVLQENVPWREAWRVDKRRSEELKRDASNFFEVAELVS